MDRWFVNRPPLSSREGWTVVWVWSTLLTLRQEARRQRNMAAAGEELIDLRERLTGQRTRLRRAADIDIQVKTILEKHHGIDEVPRRPIAKSQCDASTSNGRSTRRPSHGFFLISNVGSATWPQQFFELPIKSYCEPHNLNLPQPWGDLRELVLHCVA